MLLLAVHSSTAVAAVGTAVRVYGCRRCIAAAEGVKVCRMHENVVLDYLYIGGMEQCSILLLYCCNWKNQAAEGIMMGSR